jgi:hypothetical protein
LLGCGVAEEDKDPQMRGSMEVGLTFWKLYRDTLWERYGKELDPCGSEWDFVIKILYAIRVRRGLSLGVAIAGRSMGTTTITTTIIIRLLVVAQVNSIWVLGLQAVVHLTAGLVNVITFSFISCNVMIAAAHMATLFTPRRLNTCVAVTGAIAPSGKIYGVSGMKIKLEGAYKEGFQHVILPLQNVDTETGEVVESDFNGTTTAVFEQQMNVPVRLNEGTCKGVKLYPIDNIFDCLDLVLNHNNPDYAKEGEHYYYHYLIAMMLLMIMHIMATCCVCLCGSVWRCACIDSFLKYLVPQTVSVLPFLQIFRWRATSWAPNIGGRYRY